MFNKVKMSDICELFEYDIYKGEKGWCVYDRQTSELKHDDYKTVEEAVNHIIDYCVFDYIYEPIEQDCEAMGIKKEDYMGDTGGEVAEKMDKLIGEDDSLKDYRFYTDILNAWEHNEYYVNDLEVRNDEDKTNIKSCRQRLQTETNNKYI